MSITTSKNTGEYRKAINTLENNNTTLINSINTTNTNLTSLTNRVKTVETEVQPIARGGTGGTTAAAARKNLGITRETNGYSYNNLGALYLGGSNTNNYIRITLPQSGASFWVMCMMEISLRLYANGPKFGKIFIHGYSYPDSDWTNFYAYTTGFLKSDISVYGSDKKYLYIKIPSVTYFTCSIDKINIGDAAINYDFSDIVIDSVSSLPSTYQTASLYSMVSIKDSYTSGTSWYRIYSDGWIEQGGYFNCSSHGTTVTFHKAFSNTNYYLNGNATQVSNGVRFASFYNRSTTGAACYTGDDSSFNQGYVYWYACGY